MMDTSAPDSEREIVSDPVAVLHSLPHIVDDYFPVPKVSEPEQRQSSVSNTSGLTRGSMAWFSPFFSPTSAEKKAPAEKQTDDLDEVPQAVRKARAQWEVSIPSLKAEWVSTLTAWHAEPRTVPSTAFTLAKRGIPPSLRGLMWYRGIGNLLQVTPGLFGACLERLAELERLASAAAVVRPGILKLPTSVHRHVKSSADSQQRRLRFVDEGDPDRSGKAMFLSQQKSRSFSGSSAKSTSTEFLRHMVEGTTSSPDNTDEETTAAESAPKRHSVSHRIPQHLLKKDDRVVAVPRRSRKSRFSTDALSDVGHSDLKEDSDASDGETQLKVLQVLTRRGSMDNTGDAARHTFVKRAQCLDPVHPRETSGPVLVHGWLLIRQRRLAGKKSWERRWCMLLPRSIHMFADEPPEDEDELAGSRLGGVLLDAGIVSLSTRETHETAFEVYFPTSELSLGVRAQDKRDMQRWLAAFRGTSAVVDKRVLDASAGVVPRFVSTFNGGPVDIMEGKYLDVAGKPIAGDIPEDSAEPDVLERANEVPDIGDSEHFSQSITISDLNQFLVSQDDEPESTSQPEMEPASIADKLERVAGRKIQPHEASLAALSTDLSRTFPEFAFFAVGSDIREQLHRVLSAYAMFRPDHGYVQGFSHIAAMLLLMVGSVAPTTAATTQPQEIAPLSQSPRDDALGGALADSSAAMISPQSAVLPSSPPVADVEVYIPKSRNKRKTLALPEKPSDSILETVRPTHPSDTLVFMCFANLLSRAPLRWIAGRDVVKLQCFYRLFTDMIARLNAPIHAHLLGEGIEPNLYLISWLLTLFSKPLGLEVSVRLWDRCILGGSEEVLKCALGLLLHLAPVLQGLSFEESLRLLANVPIAYRDEFAICDLSDSIKLTPAEYSRLTALECLD